MLSRLIVANLQMLMEVTMWLMLVTGIIAGWYLKGFTGSLLGLFLAFVFEVFVFGFFLTVFDIRKSLRAIENVQTGSS